MTSLHPTERFSDRVENYIKYRPRYPGEIIPFLASETGLLPSHEIADIGSGTGILSELFLKNGNKVYGVEPNPKMREAGERLLAAYPSFVSVDATAENTTLPKTSVDFVTAGQAFHWFEPIAAKSEFLRILKPRGYVVLIWNDRKESSAFGDEYEGLLEKFGTDYAAVSAKYRSGEEPARAFFEGGTFDAKVFENAQVLDYPSFQGRVLSASYAPQPGQEKYEPMIEAIQAMFRRYEKSGFVRMEYDTRVFWGRLG